MYGIPYIFEAFRFSYAFRFSFGCSNLCRVRSPLLCTTPASFAPALYGFCEQEKGRCSCDVSKTRTQQCAHARKTHAEHPHQIHAQDTTHAIPLAWLPFGISGVRRHGRHVMVFMATTNSFAATPPLLNTNTNNPLCLPNYQSQWYCQQLCSSFSR